MVDSAVIDLPALLRRIAGGSKTEATLQSEIHMLLLAADLNLEEAVLNTTLESPSAGNRIDIEVANTCIEVKKNLGRGRRLDQAIAQLAGYVAERADSLGQRYVGVLTDGAEWRLYHLVGDTLAEASIYKVDPVAPRVDEFVAWLAGVLATETRVLPTKEAIETRLGASSAGHQLDRADLRAIYDQFRDLPEVRVKRELWAKLLRTALGTEFDAEDHELFVEHTLLVATAEVVAHAVMNFPVTELEPASLLGGDLFSRRALILGVVEHDFFDWPLHCGDAGIRWVRALARRLAQFQWASTSHDAMKTIYESVIAPATRKRLGEYYTPDFLAAHMVSETIDDPLGQRVMDPSCGSGTFLFHAIRAYLTAADKAGWGNKTALQSLVEHVVGVDLHPVAVTLARVTYLLAIGPARLQDPDRPQLRIPVFLGDSIQWGQRRDLFSSETLNVETDDGAQMFADQLRFPLGLLDDADRFDQLVAELAGTASNRAQGSPHPSVNPIARRHGLAGPELEMIAHTFATMCRLHDEGRDHIWGYFVRNLARPAWLARPGNRVDVLVGNPPWLAYRYMTAAMQVRFREMALERGLWSGGSVATQQDLSDLFVARSVEQYLRIGGRFSFVMPAGALSRRQYAGFRTANWSTPDKGIWAAFDASWDLSGMYPWFFPRTSAVVHGTRVGRESDVRVLPADVEAWSGSVADVLTRPWVEVEPYITRKTSTVLSGWTGATSPYKDRFTNGATIFPRLLTTVRPDKASPLGTGPGRVAVRSARSANENMPWKSLEDLRGVVEQEFLHPLLLGETVLPFRQLDPPSAVLPISGSGETVDPQTRPGLEDWWSRASRLWEEHRTSRMTLLDNLNYRRKLSVQFPIPSHRVVVAHSAMHVVACRVITPGAIVEHQLDWAAARSAEEASYLCAFLNAPATTAASSPHMTSGKGGGRHLGKSLWNVMIPLFDPEDPLHIELGLTPNLIAH